MSLYKWTESYVRSAGGGGAEAGARGRRPTHTHSGGGGAHNRTAPRPRVSNEQARQATASTFSYYYERRNAFCRARTKFVLLPIIKIVNTFQLAEVCRLAHRCRASDRKAASGEIFHVKLWLRDFDDCIWTCIKTVMNERASISFKVIVIASSPCFPNSTKLRNSIFFLPLTYIVPDMKYHNKETLIKSNSWNRDYKKPKERFLNILVSILLK